FAPLVSRNRLATLGILGMILILFSARTVTRNSEWYDDYTLFSADLKKSPRSIKVLTNLGYLTGKKGHIEESMEYFRKALEIDPEYDDALKGYGRRLYDRKQYEESANYYAKAVRIAPENPDSHTDYAIVLQKLEQNDAAERELQIAIQLNPSKPLPYQEMSSVLIAKQDYQTALMYLRRAESLGGDARVILNNSAVAQYLSGNVQEAYQLVVQAQSRGIQINKELAVTILSRMKQEPPVSP
ncbi:MAG: tetratricopeptide repeat protein, partial [Candidatus Latescibacterota bacterium]